LPREGTIAEQPSGADVARADVPTCLLSDDLSEVRRRVRQSEWDTCVVVNDGGVVLGRLGRKVIGSDDDQSGEEAMTEGPSTVRPSIRLDALLKRMQSNLNSWLVTTPDGKLVGLVLRSQAEDRLNSSTS